jgi:phosphomannomutase
MSNLGLERYLASRGINLVRTKVGDRYVLEAMRAGGYNVGGEQSGHMILTRPCDHRRRHHCRAAGARRAGPRASRRASCCTCSIPCRSF